MFKKSIAALALSASLLAGCATGGGIDIVKGLHVAQCLSALLSTGFLTYAQIQALGPNPDSVEVANLVQNQLGSGLPAITACAPLLEDLATREQLREQTR
jgi:predicted small secreted protein